MNRYQNFIAIFISFAMSFGQAPGIVLQQQTARLPKALLLTGTDQFPAAQLSGTQGNVDPAANANYRMRVATDEVSLTFHAADKSGRPVSDLSAGDIDLFDNERGPGEIVAMRLLTDRTLRVGFLIDTSGSVSDDVRRSRTLAVAAAQALMQDKGDSGIAIGFGRTHDIVQPWSTNLNDLSAGIERIGSKAAAVLDGTSLFDSLWSTCFYQFRGKQEKVQNVLLLFTDGLDTSSHTTLEQSVGACQQAHVSVFVFTSHSAPSDLSMGHRTLQMLTEQTGGSLIRSNGTEDEIKASIKAVAQYIRSEYQLFYRPRNLKRDGAFHQITLVGPPRVATIVGQSGYYALAR